MCAFSLITHWGIRDTINLHWAQIPLAFAFLAQETNEACARSERNLGKKRTKLAQETENATASAAKHYGSCHKVQEQTEYLRALHLQTDDSCHDTNTRAVHTLSHRLYKIIGFHYSFL